LTRIKGKITLKESYKIKVLPSGPRDASIIFIGEAPGKEEIRHGKPFMDDAGKHLTNCCKLAGMNREEVYITYISKYRVKGDKIDNVPLDELFTMYDALREEINSLPNVKIIVPLGNYALQAVTNKNGVSNYRGSPLPPLDSITHDCVVVPTIHPARICYTYKEWPYLVADLTKVKDFEDNGFEWPKWDFILKPTFEQTIDTLNMLIDMNPDFICVDVETPKNILSCIGIAWNREHAICIPLMYGSGTSYWKIENEIAIFRKLDELFRKVPIGNQNIMFDWRQLQQHGFRPTEAIKPGMLVRDPMLMHHCLYSELKHGLDTIVSIYTNLPFFKKDEEEKKGSALVSGKEMEHWTYNSFDVIGAYWCIEELEKELIEEDMMSVYKRFYSDMIPVLYGMNMRGVLVDTKLLKTVQTEANKLIEQYEKRIKETTGYTVNVNSPKQVSELLYEKLGFKKYKGEATGKKTLEKLAYKYNSDIPQMIIDIRAAKKELKLFSKENIIDGRIHCEYALHGTATGRLASRKGRGRGGMNLQNVKKEGSQRKFFIPPPGHVFMFGDQQNAEARVVAFLAKDEAMKGLFASGKSLHLENAKNILGYEITKDDPKYRVYKACVHGGNYGIGVRKFALITGLPFATANEALSAYHHRYSGIRKHFHEYVYEQIMTHRVLYNPFGRRQIFTDELIIYGKPNSKVMQAGYAFIPQSTVTDNNKLALKKLSKWYTPLLETHDGIGIAVPEKEIKYGYEAFHEAYDNKVEIFGEICPIPIDVEIGPNWKDLKEIVL